MLLNININIKKIIKSGLLLSMVVVGIMKPVTANQCKEKSVFANVKSVAAKVYFAMEEKPGRTAAILGCLALGLGGLAVWQADHAIKCEVAASMCDLADDTPLGLLCPFLWPVAMFNDDGEALWKSAAKYKWRGRVLLISALACITGAIVGITKKILRHIRDRRAKAMISEKQ